MARKKRTGAEAPDIGSILGSATGEADHDIVPGGWTGTDDATSTAPSDMENISRTPDGAQTFPDVEKEGDQLGGFSDLIVTDGEEDILPEDEQRRALS